MSEMRQPMKMAEMLVFGRVFAIGFITAEVARLAYYTGIKFALLLVDIDWRIRATGIAIGLVVCLVYALMRDAHSTIFRLGRSLRLDLLLIFLLGVWSNELISSSLVKIHEVAKGANPLLAPTVLCILFLVLLSPLCRTYLLRKEIADSQFYFLGDDEIETEEEDILQNREQAKDFAKAVLESEAHSGLVFGIDGPWGIGKTSFVNLAEQHWKEAGANSVIVFRFEPLRYATDPDLSERFIRDLSATIQGQVYAPEFLPAASRYSRMVKGISILGVRLSLEPSSETIDKLLEDIDDLLKSICRRVIVVIDDLDRLEAMTVNNVLFTIRRTFKLSQATYILCYDTENLVNGEDEGGNAREFLEKFVTVKLSLFVDSSKLRNFLLTDWQRNEHRFQTIPSDTMFKHASVLSEMAEILGENIAAKYLPLIGDMRKIKRFVNTVILLQLEKTDLGKTDFNRRDLINLILLHLNYPGLFRQIYVEETEGRSGVFSAKRSFENGNVQFSNDSEFEIVVESDNESSAQFLMRQLFDVKELQIETIDQEDESFLSSRACFNSEPYRNLEKYLKLIVRFVTPEPRETFKLYQDAVDRVKRGTSIAAIFEESDFARTNDDLAHDEFWRILVSQSYDFTQRVAEDAINTLVEYLPRYSFLGTEYVYRGLRQRSIYSLIRLLDRAGWGRTDDHRLRNRPENVVEIAQRIYGEKVYADKGLIHKLASEKRGVLGWYDLMSFRLHCSADRQGQIYNVTSALIIHDDMSATTHGLVSSLALNGMRTLSQRVFKLFQDTYIEPKRNFLVEVDKTPDNAFLGDSEKWVKELSEQVKGDSLALTDQLLAARSLVKTFVIYQLANSREPTGEGVGCGLYDESEKGDSKGISVVMNQYLFDVCFNPSVSEDNTHHFADHCLRNLSRGYWGSSDEDGYVATDKSIADGLDPAELKKYWAEFGPLIKGLNLPEMNKRVVTSNYIATYTEDLPKVFEMLDKMVG